jgi:uncharacterized protein YegL
MSKTMISKVPTNINFSATYNIAYNHVSNTCKKCFIWIKTSCSYVYSKLPEINALAHRLLNNSINLGKTVFQTSCHYTSMGYQKSIGWIAAQCNYASPKLLAIASIVKTQTFNTLNVGTTFFWTHKKIIIGCLAIGTALFAIYHFRKNRPQRPDVKLESTLNYATLNISIPKEKRMAPPKVTLTFCIDKSGSMSGDRQEAVMNAMNTVLKSAQNVVNASKEAKISLAIIGFDTQAYVYTQATKLTPIVNGSQDLPPVQKIKNQLATLTSNGGTCIMTGLEKATEELENLSKLNPDSSHTLILLTDGDSTVTAERISSVQTRLKALKAHLFAIGIGEGHKQSTLTQLTSSKTSRFKGTYINTTLGIETIESSILKIYAQAIASFQGFQLTSPQLPPGTWSVVNTSSVLENGQTKFNLGTLSEEEQLQKVIEIHGDKLAKPLDLASVGFQLTYLDPKGRLGKLHLPWKPNTTIDHQIARTATTEIRNNLRM